MWEGWGWDWICSHVAAEPEAVTPTEQGHSSGWFDPSQSQSYRGWVSAQPRSSLGPSRKTEAMESSHAHPPPQDENGWLLPAESCPEGTLPSQAPQLRLPGPWAPEVRGQLKGGRRRSCHASSPACPLRPGLYIAQNNTWMPLESGPCGLPGGWGGNESRRRFSEMQWFREEGGGAQRRPDRLLPDWCSESFRKGSSPVDRSRFLS